MKEEDKGNFRLSYFNRVNDLEFLPRILKFQKILLTQKRRRQKRCTKSLSPIFRSATPSTGQIEGEVV